MVLPDLNRHYMVADMPPKMDSKKLRPFTVADLQENLVDHNRIFYGLRDVLAAAEGLP